MKTAKQIIISFLIFLLIFPVYGARKALVIGNQNYERQPLSNPINDATDVAEVLRDLGFQVTFQTDLTNKDMDLLLRNFSNQLKREDEVVFYYSGHGVQAREENYLIPINDNIENEDELEYDALSLNRALTRLNKAGIAVIILDACRDNPYRTSRSGTRGLTNANSYPGTQYLIFSTAAGKVASDGRGQRNSPFTDTFLKYMRSSKAKIEDMMKDVSKEMREKTKGEQIPWSMGNLEADFYFQKPEEPRPSLVSYAKIKIKTNLAGELYIDGALMGSIGADGGEISGVRTGERIIRLVSGTKEQEKKLMLSSSLINEVSFFFEIPKVFVPEPIPPVVVDTPVQPVKTEEIVQSDKIKAPEPVKETSSLYTPIFIPETIAIEPAPEVVREENPPQTIKSEEGFGSLRVEVNDDGEITIAYADGKREKQRIFKDIALDIPNVKPGFTTISFLSSTLKSRSISETVIVESNRRKAVSLELQKDYTAPDTVKIPSKDQSHELSPDAINMAKAPEIVDRPLQTTSSPKKPIIEAKVGTIELRSNQGGEFFVDGLYNRRIEKDKAVYVYNIPSGERRFELRSGSDSKTFSLNVIQDDITPVKFDFISPEDLKQVRTPGSVKAKMIFVPGATFEMGDRRSEGSIDELPLHSVTLSSFYISNLELSVSEFATFITETGYKTDAEKHGGALIRIGSNDELKKEANWHNPFLKQSDFHPVVCVSWYDAITYCNWRSKKENLKPVYQIKNNPFPKNWYSGTIECDLNANGYRLPTEAEWEFAARAAATGSDFSFSGSDELDLVAWYWDYSKNKTQAVGLKEPNVLGLHDMSGNVSEWCWDWYNENYYSSSEKTNPVGAINGMERVLRGGSWFSEDTDCRVSGRDLARPVLRYNSVGFRLVRTKVE